MTRHVHLFRAFMAAPLALPLTVASQVSWAQEAPAFKEARVLIEVNATDGDIGFQAAVDADGWQAVAIHAPPKPDEPEGSLGNLLFESKGDGAVLDQTLTENFFESAEPSCTDVSLDEFLERFPKGEYRFSGESPGGNIEAVATLTHDLPGAPEDLAPAAGEWVDAENEIMITWAAGKGLGNCPPVEAAVGIPNALFGYQVVVVREDPEPVRVFQIDLPDLPADGLQMTIPAEFLEADAIYKYEVAAIEERVNEEGAIEKGNQTISQSFFCTFLETRPQEECEVPE